MYVVGNDFLPHIPTMNIAEGALDQLFAIYKMLRPAMGGYITYRGDVNLARLQMLLNEIGKEEENVFQERYTPTHTHTYTCIYFILLFQIQTHVICIYIYMVGSINIVLKPLTPEPVGIKREIIEMAGTEVVWIVICSWRRLQNSLRTNKRDRLSLPFKEI